jgi:hypothetical protein
VVLDFPPLIDGQFHAFPVLATRRVNTGEWYAKLVEPTAFCVGEMHLKLDYRRAGGCDGINEGMQDSNTAIVRLPNFHNHLRRISHGFPVHKYAR